ncbi:MAG TPA: crossover junction endodeoxyribonuclease RuvC, partial [Actinomycetota bacterium]|nr:crossover junction endodeoxyribonuclease RuvC [Actinomycetota bacterium]
AAGVALLVAGRLGIPVHEYSPAQVKKAVVGTGTASKEQVRYMVDRLLGKVVDVPTADASDALGIAITHLNSHRIERMIGAAG